MQTIVQEKISVVTDKCNMKTANRLGLTIELRMQSTDLVAWRPL